MIEIDGSLGEGGGQVLRTSVGLSLATGQPVRVTRIRAGRAKPGLMRQHRTAVLAAAEIGGGSVDGAELGSQELVFRPGTPRAGRYRFSIGSAGSTGLVLQTVLPALIVAGGESELEFEGGTHNPLAPPFEFLERCFVPALRALGLELSLQLERHGFVAAGGGRLRARLRVSDQLRPAEFLQRGALVRRRATILLAQLPAAVADSEWSRVKSRLRWDDSELELREVESAGPGNALLLSVEHEHASELTSSFGERSVRSMTVADRAVDALREYLDSDAPVGEHLADQLLIPLALAGGGAFRTLPLSPHALTNLEVVKRFLPVEFHVVDDGPRSVRVEVRVRQ